jgi:hypothetical protein
VSDLDIFAGLTTTAGSDSDTDVQETDKTVIEDEEPETEDDTEDESSEETEEETVVSTLPDGAVSVTDFAAWMTQELMREKIHSGEPLTGTEYVLPQPVYQAIKAKKDPLPHVMVKTDDDSEPRVYVLRDEAAKAWRARLVRTATRGAGSLRASTRSADDLLALHAEAVKKVTYAVDRAALWDTNLEKAQKLVAKYESLLRTANVDDTTIKLSATTAVSDYVVEKEEKAAEKAAKKAQEK